MTLTELAKRNLTKEYKDFLASIAENGIMIEAMRKIILKNPPKIDVIKHNG